MNKHEYDELVSRAEKANELYRAGEDSGMSDAAYDAIIEQIREAEAANPDWGVAAVSSTVGSDLTAGFKRVSHKVPMLSIDDVFERREEKEHFADVMDWCYKTGQECYGLSGIKDCLNGISASVQVKLDGCAMTLVYDNGELQYAATRGDGKVGDNITANALQMIGVPKTIPYKDRVEIRGEAIMYREDFERVNAEQQKNGLKEYANPRNLTAGTIKSLDPSVVAHRCIRFIAHGIVGYPETEDSFPYNDLQTVCLEAGIEPVISTIRYLHEDGSINRALFTIRDMRDTLPYDIDGAVIKVEEYKLREQLGCTARAPRWACAVKFLPEQKVTTITKIALQVGRTGNITPVAHLAPVLVSGSTVSRATLHNQNEINRLGVRAGAQVKIEKAGEIIPAVVEVVDPGPKAKPFDIWESTNGLCPCCGTPLVRDPEMAAIKCPNLYCEGKLREQLIYMCSRQALDIAGIGKVAADALVSQGYVGNLLDLFRLTLYDFATLNLADPTTGTTYRVGEKMATKIKKAIDAAKTAPFSKWLTAVGIPGVGKTTAQKLAKMFTGFGALKCAGTDIKYIVGDVVGDNIVKWFESNFVQTYILNRFDILDIYPATEVKAKEEPKSSKLDGETIVITGTLSQPRSVFESLIEENGGTVGSSVSKKTTLLLAGEKAGSKLKKAESLGVRVITEDEFNSMIA